MLLLKTRAKNKSTSFIEIDEKIRGVLPDRTLRNFSIPGNTDITIESSVAAALDAEIIAYAWSRFLKWLAFQERSVDLSRQYLLQFPLAEDLAENLIDLAKKNNYLNDERFTQLAIESYIEKNKSRMEIKSKLYEKQLPMPLIERYLSSLYDEKAQDMILSNQVMRLYERWRSLDPQEIERKVCDSLAKRGFNYYEVQKYCQRMNNEKEDYD
jgi:regulatory protein